jgi:hypothetical protein
LWSKEGDTSEVQHDAAYVELPDARKLILVVLTRGAADDPTPRHLQRPRGRERQR